MHTQLQERAALWTPTGFVDDDFTTVETLDEAEGGGDVIVPLAAFLELSPEEKQARNGRIGVLIGPDDKDWERSADAVLGADLVALSFPAYTDGRAYSKATKLRGKYGYGGKLRAVGDVLYDQIAHMIRTGFDEFAIVNAPTRERLEAGHVPGIDIAYQPATRGADEGPAYSWRRRHVL